MKTLVYSVIVLSILTGVGFAAYKPATDYWAKRNRPIWRTAKTEKGEIIEVVNSTGSLKPKLEVAIGSFVSGPILELYCEFNQEVKKGDILAKIDPQIYQSNVARDEASLANREADIFRVRAQLQQAINDEKRAIALRDRDPTFMAQAEMDKFKFTRLSLDAQLKVAYAAVDQARASLENSQANLGYTLIKAPVDGTVINRKIDPGQTLAAQFQTPELFVIAPDMRKEMHIRASVDEADIGKIQVAHARKYPVTFTVDAHPTLFHGTISEIRLSFTTTQNVVTYPVIVSAANPDLKLLPGMTASLSFQVDRRDNVIKIPNAALRFYPLAQHVRAADLPILEGVAKPVDDSEEATESAAAKSATQRTQLRTEQKRRHVWIAEGDKLKAVEVITGLIDSEFTEQVKGDLKPGDVLVTGIQAPPVAR